MFSPGASVPVRHPRTNFVLDDNAKQPAVTCMGGRNFQRRDGRDFAEILALLIAEMAFPSHGNVAHLSAAAGVYPEGRGRR